MQRRSGSAMSAPYCAVSPGRRRHGGPDSARAIARSAPCCCWSAATRRAWRPPRSVRAPGPRLPLRAGRPHDPPPGAMAVVHAASGLDVNLADQTTPGTAEFACFADRARRRSRRHPRRQRARADAAEQRLAAATAAAPERDDRQRRLDLGYLGYPGLRELQREQVCAAPSPRRCAATGRRPVRVLYFAPRATLTASMTTRSRR